MIVAAKDRFKGKTTSKYRGVFWERGDKVWRAKIKGQHIGCFKKEEEAAKAYDSNAKSIFGTDAKLNFP